MKGKEKTRTRAIRNFEDGRVDRIYDLIKDIKENGMMYLKNNITVARIKQIAPEISIHWDKQEECYIAYYGKDVE